MMLNTVARKTLLQRKKCDTVALEGSRRGSVTHHRSERHIVFVSVKTVRNKQAGQSERYGFIEFNSHAAAEKVMQSYNGTMMPNTEQPFRLNWAGFSTGDRRPEPGSDLSIFVGDLATDVTDEMLHNIFASRYPSVKGATVVVDSSTGRPKGYGFVRFGVENDRSQALTEMNGVCCSSRPMRVGVATPKKPSVQQQYSAQVTETFALFCHL